METFSKTRAMDFTKTKSKTKDISPKPNNRSSKPVSSAISPDMAMDTVMDIHNNNNNNSCSTTALNSDISSKAINSNSTKPARHTKKGLSSSLKKLSDDIKAKRKSIAARHQLLLDVVSSSPPIAALRFLSITARRSASKSPKQRSSRCDAASPPTPLSDDLTRPSPAPKPPPPSPRSISLADPVDPLQIVASSASDSSDLTSTLASPSTDRPLPAPVTRSRRYAFFTAAFLTTAFVIAVSAGKTFALSLTGAAYLLFWLKGNLTFDAASQGSDGRATTLPLECAEVFRRSLTVPYHRARQLSPSKVPDRSNSLPLDSRFARFCAEKRQADVSSSGNLTPWKENLQGKLKLQVMLLLVLLGLLQGKIMAIVFVFISICLVSGLNSWFPVLGKTKQDQAAKL